MTKIGWLRTSLLCASLLFAGCAHYYAVESDLSNRVNRWNGKKAYGKSISTLELVKQSNDNYTELQTLLEKTKVLASVYEKQLLTEADKLIQGNHWQQALNLYDSGLANLPNSYPFEQARNSYYKKRKQHTENLRRKLLIAEGRSLPYRAPLINEIAKINPDNNAAQERAIAITHQVEDTTKRLLKLGKTALKENNNNLAMEYLTLANHLSPTKDTASALKKINNRLDTIAKKKKQFIEIKQKSRARQLLSQYNELFDKKHYAEAKERLEQLHTYREETPDISQLEIKLEQAIMKEIQSSIEQGQRYYSKGQFEEAYHTWRESLSLSPNNAALLAHIERVQRVLESLRRLNNTGQTLEFPAE
ncbi:MAG: hypothetical protein JKY67_13710 [Pseudomonadales bacterium]|nr:hypothetical protein [Pseudomonadales bacterium]